MSTTGSQDDAGTMSHERVALQVHAHTVVTTARFIRERANSNGDMFGNEFSHRSHQLLRKELVGALSCEPRNTACGIKVRSINHGTGHVPHLGDVNLSRRWITVGCPRELPRGRVPPGTRTGRRTGGCRPSRACALYRRIGGCAFCALKRAVAQGAPSRSVLGFLPAKNFGSTRRPP